MIMLIIFKRASFVQIKNTHIQKVSHNIRYLEINFLFNNNNNNNNNIILIKIGRIKYKIFIIPCKSGCL